jgi:hypothetical protein
MEAEHLAATLAWAREVCDEVGGTAGAARGADAA